MGGSKTAKILPGFITSLTHALYVKYIITISPAKPFSTAAYTIDPKVLQWPFLSLLAHKATNDEEASARVYHHHRPGMTLRNDSVQPQAWSSQFPCPHGSAQNTCPPTDSLPRAAGLSKYYYRETPHLVWWSQASRSQAAGDFCPACGPAVLISQRVCTALHAALLTVPVQVPASTESLLSSYLLLQSLPPFIECQPKSALLPSQPRA